MDMPEEQRPFRVVTTAGVRHSGHMTRDLAESRAKLANEEAARLGIEARYEVIEKP